MKLGCFGPWSCGVCSGTLQQHSWTAITIKKEGCRGAPVEHRQVSTVQTSHFTQKIFQNEKARAIPLLLIPVIPFSRWFFTLFSPSCHLIILAHL